MSFDDKIAEIPATMPMLPVRDIVVFPYMILPLFVGREASIRSVEEALSKNRLIFLATQKEIAEENPTADWFCFQCHLKPKEFYQERPDPKWICLKPLEQFFLSHY